MSVLIGTSRRSALMLALCVCWLFLAVAPGHALISPSERQALTQGAKALCEAYCKKLPDLKQSETLKLLTDSPELLGLIVTLLAGGALAGGAIAGRARYLKSAKPEVIWSVESGVKEPQDADVMVIGPARARPSEEIIVQVIVHTPDREAEARSKALKLEPHGQDLASSPLTIRLKMNDIIGVTLECDRATIVEPLQSAFWNGRYVNLQFQLQLPETETSFALTSKLRVFINSVLAGNVIFRIAVSPEAAALAPSFVPQQGHPYRKYFLSYAKEDRAEVLKFAQTLNFLHVDYFQDVLKLDPRERWERRLYQEIENRDIFVLFWSRHARASEWVLKEAEYALLCSKKNSIDPRPEISPYPLEPPSSVEPPASLREINFNDPIRYAIFVEELRTKKKPARRKRLRHRH